jgi:VanZ family protein
MRRLVAARALFAALFLLVTYLSVTPDPDAAGPSLDFARWIANLLFGDEIYGDKVAHFLAYGALGLSAAAAHVRIARRFTFVVLGLALYGALLEGVQALGAVRQPEALDAFANAAGALSGGAGAALVSRLRELARA